MSILQKLDNKFGHRRGPNMIYILMGCYILGTLLRLFDPVLENMLHITSTYFLYLSPTGVFHGEVWRLVTWIIHPGNSSIFMMALMIFVYISIAKTLEQVVGLFKLNFFLISGLVIELLAGLLYFFVMPYPPRVREIMLVNLDPYYVYASLFTLFALMFPDARFRLMFLIPVRGKWMIFISIALYFVDVVRAFTGGIPEFGWLLVFMIVAAVINIMLFMFLLGAFSSHRPRNTVNMNRYQRTHERSHTQIQYRHKCEVCGRTEKSNPELEFRYCSKCQGNHEYCMEHLYTHIHSS